MRLLYAVLKQRDAVLRNGTPCHPVLLSISVVRSAETAKAATGPVRRMPQSPIPIANTRAPHHTILAAGRFIPALKYPA